MEVLQVLPPSADVHLALPILQPARVFSLERDAIEGRLLWFGEASRYSKADSGTAGHEDQANDEDREDGTFERIQLCGESPELATMRTQAYIQAWEACQSDIRVSPLSHVHQYACFPNSVIPFSGSCKRSTMIQ